MQSKLLDLNINEITLANVELIKYIPDRIRFLEDKIKLSIEKQTTQIYHYSNKGHCSWFDFANEIFKLANINYKVQVNSISTEEYLMAAERPKNSVINNKKIENDFNIDTFNWKDSLKKCLLAYELANSIKRNE